MKKIYLNVLKKSRMTIKEPIFIWGTGRSGTHLLYDIMSLHPGVCSPKTKNRWKKGLWGSMHYGDTTPKKLKKYLPPVEGMHAIWESVGVDPNFRGVLRREGMDKLQKQAVVDNYMKLATQWKWNKSSKKFRVLDKTPKYIMMVEVINEIFPDAYHIFCLRDPRAVINSILRIMRFTAKETSGKEYADGFWGKMYPEGFEDCDKKAFVETLCWQIKHLIELGFSYQKILGKRLIFFRYEELLNNAHDAIRDLYKKVKLLSFEEICKLIPNIFPNYSPKWPGGDKKFSSTFDVCFNDDELIYFEDIDKLAQRLGYNIDNVGSIVCPITLQIRDCK